MFLFVCFFSPFLIFLLFWFGDFLCFSIVPSVYVVSFVQMGSFGVYIFFGSLAACGLCTFEFLLFWVWLVSGFGFVVYVVSIGV